MDAANASDPREPVIATRIATQPQATWYTTYNPSTIQSDASTVTSAAAATGKTPILVMYDIPNRDCGGARPAVRWASRATRPTSPSFAAGLGTAP